MTTANTWGCCYKGDGEMRPFLKPGWSPFNAMLMVFGFIVFFPLGLAMLAWNIWGHRWGDVKGDFRRSFNAQKNWTGGVGNWNGPAMSDTGNVAFDEYRAAELIRLEEQRRKFDDIRKEFDDHLKNLGRAREQQEFDNFMNARGAEKSDTSKKDDNVSGN